MNSPPIVTDRLGRGRCAWAGLAMPLRAAARMMRAVRAPERQRIFEARAPHPCAHPGCPELVPAGDGGKCPQHTPPKRRTGKPRPMGWAWTRKREQVIRRDGRKCQRCGSTDQLRVHHIVPVSEGGTDDERNLTTLCNRCHLEAHRPLGHDPAEGVPVARRGEFSRYLRFPKSAGNEGKS